MQCVHWSWPVCTLAEYKQVEHLDKLSEANWAWNFLILSAVQIVRAVMTVLWHAAIDLLSLHRFQIFL